MQTIQLDLTLVQHWHDNRLNLSVIEPNQNFVVTKPGLIRQFWLPDLYLVNSLTATVVNAFQPIEKLTITPDGLVSYAQRINALLSCPMNLANFPHDFQYCRIKMSTSKSHGLGAGNLICARSRSYISLFKGTGIIFS